MSLTKMEDEMGIQEAASQCTKNMEHLISLLLMSHQSDQLDFAVSKFKEVIFFLNQITNHARFARGPVQSSFPLSSPSASFGSNFGSGSGSCPWSINLNRSITWEHSFEAREFYQEKHLKIEEERALIKEAIGKERAFIKEVIGEECNDGDQATVKRSEEVSESKIKLSEVEEKTKYGLLHDLIPPAIKSFGAREFYQEKHLKEVIGEECNDGDQATVKRSEEVSESKIKLSEVEEKTTLSLQESSNGLQHDLIPHAIKRKRRINSRIIVPAISLKINDIPADEYSWRKYGQKPVKGSPYPRGYYKCSVVRKCPARKQVERTTHDPIMLIITYEGEHRHADHIPILNQNQYHDFFQLKL